MANKPFVREERYRVFKVKDMDQVLTEFEQGLLLALHRKIHLHRIAAHQPPLDCVVVESDWPEYEPTWAAIEARMNKENTNG